VKFHGLPIKKIGGVLWNATLIAMPGLATPRLTEPDRAMPDTAAPGLAQPCSNN